MSSNSVLALVASGLFSLLVAAVSGGIAFRTARANARGELVKIQEQVNAQQAVLEKAKIAELRQSYLTPLRYYAHALSLRLGELEMKFQSPENDIVRGWFKTMKDHVTRDKRHEHYEAWCYYTGVFAVSTLYYTCSYFYSARAVRFYRPFGESRPAYSEALEALLLKVADAFGGHGLWGIWDTAQEVIGERFATNNSSMTYAEMCGAHESEDPFRRVPFFRPLDFYWEELDVPRARGIRLTLDELMSFLDSEDPQFYGCAAPHPA